VPLYPFFIRSMLEAKQRKSKDMIKEGAPS